MWMRRVSPGAGGDLPAVDDNVLAAAGLQLLQRQAPRCPSHA